jgi:hypothetical protein
MGLFGGGNSSSSTQNKTDNIDQKLQMAAGSVGGTASGGGVVNINTSDMGAIDSSFKFANASSDSAFKFGNAAIDANAYVTDGALGFAAGNSDSAFKLVNATVDGALKTVSDSAAKSAAAMAAASDNAMKLANATTDSALKFGDSTVAQSFDFAKAITSGAANEVAASATRADQMVTNAMGSVKDAYSSVGSSLETAYTNAKAGEQKIMVAAALAILGLVAIKMGR